MANTIETKGKIFMGDHGNSGRTIIIPHNGIEEAVKKQKEEKELEEAGKVLVELQKAKQEEILSKLETLEMLPVGVNLIILPYPENPYKKFIEGNIIVDTSSIFLNPDTGEMDKNELLVKAAKVIEVGPDCKYVRPGDDVFYPTRVTSPIPFMSMGYLLINEPNIVTFIGQNLKERIKNGK